MICSLLEIRFHGPGRLEENSEGWVGHGEKKNGRKHTPVRMCERKGNMKMYECTRFFPVS